MVYKFHSVLHQSYLFTCASCLLSEYKLISGGADRKDPPPPRFPSNFVEYWEYRSLTM